MTRDRNRPDLSLDAPSSFVFDVRKCTEAYRLNQFAISLKDAKNRERFVADERAAMTAFGLSDVEIDMVEARDWTGLVSRGGHVLAIVKIAYSLGVLHHEVGAHMCGVAYSELREHQKALGIDLLPQDIGADGRG